MATAREYFDRAPHVHLHADRPITVGAEEVITTDRTIWDVEGASKYFSVYIPETPHICLIIRNYLDQHWHMELDDGLYMTQRFKGHSEELESADCRPSNRLFVYTPMEIPKGDIDWLYQYANSIGINLKIRDKTYVDARNNAETPDAFISHDGRDKDALARPLAEELSKIGYNVWYDEFSLVPGQSLRESIERGLKQTRKCIVIISEHFLDNKGWTRAEFDSIYTREIHQGDRLIVPIWHNVDKKRVYEYSPRLADVYAIHSNQEIEDIAKAVRRALEHDQG